MPASPLALVAVAALAFALYAWGRWVTRRQRAPVFRFATHGIWVGTSLALAGALWAVRRLADVSETLAPTAASDAAAQHAEQISRTVGIAALPVGLGNLVLLASVIVLIAGTLRAPDRAPPER